MIRFNGTDETMVLIMKRCVVLMGSIAAIAMGVAVSGCYSASSAARSRNSASSASAGATAAPQPPARPDYGEIIQRAAASRTAPFEGKGWRSLFDGKSLVGWRETQFAGRGDVEIKSGLMVMNMGDPFTGVNWTSDIPKVNYEVALDAMRISGSDFFCGLTVPVGHAHCSLIVGGWGGSLVGISSLDGLDASENETTKFMNFEPGRWYRIRLRITETKIAAWIDDEKLIDVSTTGKRISVRPGDIEMSKPFGISCWQCTAAMREIKVRDL